MNSRFLTRFKKSLQQKVANDAIVAVCMQRLFALQKMKVSTF